VSLMGRVEDVSLIELLHMLALGEKSGKLVFSQHRAEGVIVLRHGRIIYAASNSVREALGNILVCRKLVSEQALSRALDIQRRSAQEKRLGTILIELGEITQPVLNRIIREQIERIVGEFIRWETGFFRFETIEIHDRGEVEVDARNFLLDIGLNTEQVVLDVAKSVDEAKRRHDAFAAATGRTLPGRLSDTRSKLPQAPPAPADGTTLRSIMAQIKPRSFRGEVTVALFKQAGAIVPRGVLFIPSHGGLVGVGQFGIELPGASADEKVRALLVPTDQPSLLARVMASKRSYRGPLSSSSWDDYLVKELGGAVPSEAVGVPATAGDDVLAIFYGDNGPSRQTIGPLGPLEDALRAAGDALSAGDHSATT
jgi:hypothetical protein